MNRDYITEAYLSVTDQETVKQTAFHEAGYAAAIYLRNRKNKLPPVYFQVATQAANDSLNFSGHLSKSENSGCLARVVGGRLIDPLSISIKECVNDFSEADKNAFKTAFEADIINLIVGPLAEAKYVHTRDDEIMNSYLVNFNALNFYGGSKCIEITKDYLDSFITDEKLREKKVSELFSKSFDFISDHSNWKAITALADHILMSRKNIIDCEEAVGVLESNLANSYLQ